MSLLDDIDLIQRRNESLIVRFQLCDNRVVNTGTTSGLKGRNKRWMSRDTNSGCRLLRMHRRRVLTLSEVKPRTSQKRHNGHLNRTGTGRLVKQFV